MRSKATAGGNAASTSPKPLAKFIANRKPEYLQTTPFSYALALDALLGAHITIRSYCEHDDLGERPKLHINGAFEWLIMHARYMRGKLSN